MDISTQHCAEGKAKVSSFPFRCVGRISYILQSFGTQKTEVRHLNTYYYFVYLLTSYLASYRAKYFNTLALSVF